MNDDQFDVDDLKQFIEATVSQSEVRLREEITDTVSQSESRLRQEMGDLRQEMGELHQEMRDGFAGVGEAFAPANDQLEDHEARITTLEQSAA